MNKRLLLIADYLKGLDTIIDVGCDHCYLCLHLLKNSYVNYVINIDINEQPLNSGKKNIPECYLNKTEFILNDGLKQLDLYSDAIVISGMGTKKIIDIILSTKNQPKKFYIIQTNNNPISFRTFLKNNNGFILDEQVVFENNKYYEIIQFYFSKKTNLISENDIIVGPILKNKFNSINKDYFLNRIDKIKSFYSNKINIDKKKELEILENFFKLNYDY